MKSPPSFVKESDLCAAFVAAIPEGWTAYPETQGWDLLLVRGNGAQVGVQAKLRLNVAVLNQAAETRFGHIYYQDRPGPDYRAVLVPHGQTTGLHTLAPYCALTVIQMRSPDRYGSRFDPELPVPNTGRFRRYYEDWHEMMPARRHPLPEYVPDVLAGASAPIQLTDWKIRALKLCVLSETTGYITR